MKKNLGFMLLPILVVPLNAFAQTIYRDRFTETNIPDEASGLIVQVIYSPWITLALVASVLLLIGGLFFRVYKLAAVSGLLAILIVSLRFFAEQLSGSYSIFQAKVIIPLFLLTIVGKLVSDYFNKKRDEEDDEAPVKTRTKSRRRKIDASERAEGTAAQFGSPAKKESGAQLAGDSVLSRGSSSAAAPRLNRSF